jgi:mono/diheme cytochrome c family protein
VTVLFGADVVPILENNCAACHTTGGAGAALLTMFNSGGAVDYTAVSGAIDTILSKVTTNQMPQGGPPLSEAEKETLRTWMDEGALNN